MQELKEQVSCETLKSIPVPALVPGSPVQLQEIPRDNAIQSANSKENAVPCADNHQATTNSHDTSKSVQETVLLDSLDVSLQMEEHNSSSEIYYLPRCLQLSDGGVFD